MPEDKALIALRRRVDHHIDEYRMHLLEEEKRDARLERAQERTDESLDKLIASTQGLVDSWTFAINLQKLLKWLATFSIIGGLAAAVLAKLKGVI
jgi:hypothetical protein